MIPQKKRMSSIMENKYHSGFCIDCGKKLPTIWFKNNMTGRCQKCYWKSIRGVKTPRMHSHQSAFDSCFGKKVKIWTHCHKCQAWFELRDGQQGCKKSNGEYMAWCPACREMDEYINFSVYHQDRFPVRGMDPKGDSEDRPIDTKDDYGFQEDCI